MPWSQCLPHRTVWRGEALSDTEPLCRWRSRKQPHAFQRETCFVGRKKHWFWQWLVAERRTKGSSWTLPNKAPSENSSLLMIWAEQMPLCQWRTFRIPQPSKMVWNSAWSCSYSYLLQFSFLPSSSKQQAKEAQQQQGGTPCSLPAAGSSVATMPTRNSRKFEPPKIQRTSWLQHLVQLPVQPSSSLKLWLGSWGLREQSERKWRRNLLCLLVCLEFLWQQGMHEPQERVWW